MQNWTSSATEVTSSMGIHENEIVDPFLTAESTTERMTVLLFLYKAMIMNTICVLPSEDYSAWGQQNREVKEQWPGKDSHATYRFQLMKTGTHRKAVPTLGGQGTI